jgi:hypothetical protein
MKGETAFSSFLNWMRENSAWLQSGNVVILVAAALAVVAKSSTSTLILVLLALLITITGLFAGRTPAQDFPTRKVLSYSDSSPYQFTLSNFPQHVDPRLLEIKSQESISPKIDHTYIDRILSVVGDIAFYDGSEKIVHIFPKPVKLTFNYTAKDYNEFLKHRETLLADKKILSVDEAKFMPVYLYNYPDENPRTGVWKPFQNYSMDLDKQTFTVEFEFWGDQQIGYGTKP